MRESLGTVVEVSNVTWSHTKIVYSTSCFSLSLLCSYPNCRALFYYFSTKDYNDFKYVWHRKYSVTNINKNEQDFPCIYTKTTVYEGLKPSWSTNLGHSTTIKPIEASLLSFVRTP